MTRCTGSHLAVPSPAARDCVLRLYSRVADPEICLRKGRVHGERKAKRKVDHGSKHGGKCTQCLLSSQRN